MKKLITLALILFFTPMAVPTAQAEETEWTQGALSKIAPGVSETVEEIKLKGKLISKPDKDGEGNPITRVFLEKDDGKLIPLPCERKGTGDGVVGKISDLGGDPSCWKYLGQKVEVVGQVQSVTKKTKRYMKLGKIVSMTLF